MLTIGMTGGRQISHSPLLAERIKKVHEPLCPVMDADNIKIIRCVLVSIATPLSPIRGPPP